MSQLSLLCVSSEIPSCPLRARKNDEGVGDFAGVSPGQAEEFQEVKVNPSVFLFLLLQWRRVASVGITRRQKPEISSPDTK